MLLLLRWHVAVVLIQHRTQPHLEPSGKRSAICLCLRKEERADFRGVVDGVDDLPHDGVYRGVWNAKPRCDIQVGTPREHSQPYRQADFHLDNSILRATQSCVSEKTAEARRTLVLVSSTSFKPRPLQQYSTTRATRAVAVPAAIHCSCIGKLEYFCCDAAVRTAAIAAAVNHLTGKFSTFTVRFFLAVQTEWFCPK